MDVLQGGEGAADDSLCDVDHSVELLAFCLSAAGEPHHDAVRQNGLNGGAVEGHCQFLANVVLPEHSQEVQALLCLFNDSCGVCRPGEVGRAHGAQEGEGVEPLYAVSVDVEWVQICPVLSEVQNDLLGLCCVQSQVVSQAALGQFQDLVSVV